MFRDKNLFIILFFFSIFSCENYYPLDKLNDRIIESNGFFLKDGLKDLKIQDLTKYVEDPNYYYFYGIIYYNNFGLDKWSSYFFIQGISTDNLFKKESFNSLLKIYIKEKEWENLRLLFTSYGHLIDEKYSGIIKWFFDGKKPDTFSSFPQEIEFLNLINYILEMDEEYVRNENGSLLKDYVYSLLFKNIDNEDFKNSIAKFSSIKRESIFKLIYHFLNNEKKEFKNNLKYSLSEANSYEDFDIIREMAIKLNLRKEFFIEMEDIYYKKTIYAEYFYLIDLLKFKGNGEGLPLCKKFLIKLTQYKDSPFYNEMDYNIRQIILNREISLNEKWINDVFSLVNDYPNRFSSLSLLNLLIRSAIYQKKEDILLKNIEKLDFDKLDEYNKTSLFYALYLIDRDKNKWKSKLEDYPVSYGHLKINNGVNKDKILKNKKIFKSEDFSEYGKIISKKLDYYLLFNITTIVQLIKDDKELKNSDKYELYQKIRSYYLKKENYYEAVKYAILSAYALYGDNLKEIDIETLKEMFPFHYKDFVFKYSQENNIEPALSYGVMREESRYSPTIVSIANAIGLMQIIPKTGKFIASKIGMDKYDLTDPEDNIKMGTFYLKFLKDHYFKEYGFILASYNAGQGRTKGWYNSYKDFPEDIIYELIPVAETRNYIRKVLRSYYIYDYLIKELDK